MIDTGEIPNTDSVWFITILVYIIIEGIKAWGFQRKRSKEWASHVCRLSSTDRALIMDIRDMSKELTVAHTIITEEFKDISKSLLIVGSDLEHFCGTFGDFLKDFKANVDNLHRAINRNLNIQDAKKIPDA